jgi:23S rRNA pseudouridine1911/1915/1917 synthase
LPNGSEEWENNIMPIKKITKKIKKTAAVSVLYEDKDVLVLNKPAGLVVHSDGKTKEPSLADWIGKKYPRLKKVGEPTILPNGKKILRPGIVHRLDRDTSGAIIIVKSQETFLHLKEQFQSREIKKFYRAFVYGELTNDRGIINRPIGRSPSDFRQWSATRGARGEMREAETRYRVIQKKNGISYVEIMPQTGRTHQIRVHFKAINHPIIHDELYAEGRESLLGFKRLALHAFRIQFTLPAGKAIEVEAPFPEDFEKAIAHIAKE